jgi:uncharacterized protein YciU (UPF0263 family)
MKADNKIADEVTDDSEDYQCDVSFELSIQFIDDVVLPLIDEFDNNNEDEDFIPGYAAYTLYTKLTNQLLCDGYSKDDLKQVIDDFATQHLFEHIH